jgi:deoxyribonuclease-4
MTHDKDRLLIGAHTSAAGGLHNALLQGREIGATTIQLFTSNQRQWKSRALTGEEIIKWQATLQETGLSKIMSHASYLINLGAPDEINLIKSRDSFRQELIRCTELGISFLNFHPGAALKDDPQQCLDRIVESLLLVEDIAAESPTKLILEMTAGQGSCVGCRFEQMHYIIDRLQNRIPIGVCIDTCHIFVAGYDIRTEAMMDSVLDDFDRIIGLQYLNAFHLNDSMKGLGSRVDRHQDLGKGEIGMECFKTLMKDPRTQEIPKYLETPNGPPVWKEEINLLRQLAYANENQATQR